LLDLCVLVLEFLGSQFADGFLNNCKPLFFFATRVPLHGLVDLFETCFPLRRGKRGAIQVLDQGVQFFLLQFMSLREFR